LARRLWSAFVPEAAFTGICDRWSFLDPSLLPALS